MSEIPPDSQPDDRSPHFAGSGRQDEVNTAWEKLFAESTAGLRAFLRSRLSQDSDVDDCLQVVFVKMIECGRDVRPAARRAWLFRVAANESARLWRRKSSTEKMLTQQGASQASPLDPSETVIRSETSEKLVQAVGRLPPGWQQVVRLRMHENLTFQQIANRLDIPLGTALTHMRRALERLRNELEANDP